MKKMIIFFAIVIIIISGITYMYLNYKANYNITKRENWKFESFLNEEVTGVELASVINKAIDNNTQNNVERNHKGIYIDNSTNSISIEVKMIDDDSIYQMETLYNGGMQNFVNYYGKITFKCIDIKYHDSTNKVKYMLFEQITS